MDCHGQTISGNMDQIVSLPGVFTTDRALDCDVLVLSGKPDTLPTRSLNCQHQTWARVDSGIARGYSVASRLSQKSKIYVSSESSEANFRTFTTYVHARAGEVFFWLIEGPHPQKKQTTPCLRLARS